MKHSATRPTGSDKLKLHRAIAGAKLGGVGPGLSPKTALSTGLKVDMDALTNVDLTDAGEAGHPRIAIAGARYISAE